MPRYVVCMCVTSSRSAGNRMSEGADCFGIAGAPQRSYRCAWSLLRFVYFCFLWVLGCLSGRRSAPPLGCAGSKQMRVRCSTEALLGLVGLAPCRPWQELGPTKTCRTARPCALETEPPWAPEGVCATAHVRLFIVLSCATPWTKLQVHRQSCSDVL